MLEGKEVKSSTLALLGLSAAISIGAIYYGHKAGALAPVLALLVATGIGNAALDAHRGQ